MSQDPASFVGQPVRSLQEMLRTISYVHPALPPLFPNGTFGEGTLEAVMLFQREFGLPVTGTVTLTDWKVLTAEYRRVKRLLARPQTAALFPAGGDVFQPGDRDPLLYPIQGMFCALAEGMAGIEPCVPSGVFDQATGQNVRWLQGCAGLPVTGALDQETWASLCRLYATFLTRRRELPDAQP
jgi:hypothetical protein